MKLTPNTKVAFDDFLHTYLMGDKFLLGVTSLMRKHGLSADYGDVDPEVLACAAARGTAVHKACEDYDNGETVVYADVYHNGKLVLSADELKANLAAYTNLGLKTLASEFLISDNKLVASSIDKVLDCGEDGYVDLGDIKTTYQLHIGPLEWQLALYKYLLERQCKGVKVRKCWGIHIRKGRAVIKEITPVSEDKVEELLRCEAEGRIYTEEKTEAVSVISAGELTALVNAENNITSLKAALKDLEEKSQGIKDKVYGYMMEHNIKELQCGDGVLVLKAPTTRNGVDSKKLEAEYPDVFAACRKVSEVKGSVTYKTK